MASGSSYKEIAEKMGVTIVCVYFHLRAGWRKIGAKNSVQAVAKMAGWNS